MVNNLPKFLLFHFISVLLILTTSCSAQTTTPAPTPTSPPTSPAIPPPTPEPPKPAPAPTPKEAELKYDDGKERDALAAGGGYLIDYVPPSTPFTITKIKVLGGLYGSGYEGKDFKVEIWDNNQKVIHSATYPVTKFSVAPPNKWADFEVPNITVTGKFYIHVFTGTDRLKGIHIGADDSIVNEHSEHTILTVLDAIKVRPDWPYPSNQWLGDKSKVNWMIRAVGTYLEK